MESVCVCVCKYLNYCFHLEELCAWEWRSNFKGPLKITISGDEFRKIFTFTDVCACVREIYTAVEVHAMNVDSADSKEFRDSIGDSRPVLTA